MYIKPTILKPWPKTEGGGGACVKARPRTARQILCMRMNTALVVRMGTGAAYTARAKGRQLSD